MRLPGDVTAGHGEPGNTMLHLAIREHLTDLALYLVSCDVDLDVHAADSMGNTALTYALRQDNDHLCAQLIRDGVVANQRQYLHAFSDVALTFRGSLIKAKVTPF